MKTISIFFLLFFVLFKRIKVVESVIQRQNVYLDDDFKSFTYFFASSPSADFLARIVHSNDNRFQQIKTNTGLFSKTVDKAFAINQVSNDIMKTFISILLFTLLPYFAYIGIFGHTNNLLTLSLSSICAYFTMLIAFFLTNGIFNIGLVCSIPLVLSIFVFCLCKTDCNLRTLYTYTRYICSFIFAKLIYDIITNIIGDASNNLDYGLSGFIYINILRGTSYFVLKIIHLLILSLIAFIIIKLFPKYFSENTLQSPETIQSDKCIVSFLYALPIAASLTQIFILIKNTLNPIDPSLFFMIPSSINFLSINTIFSLITWLIVSYGLVKLSKLVEKDYNNILNKIPIKISEMF